MRAPLLQQAQVLKRIAIDGDEVGECFRLDRTNGERVNSFAGLIDHLGTMTCNTMRVPLAAKHHFTLTPLQDAHSSC
jgi:hypothetical protein